LEREAIASPSPASGDNLSQAIEDKIRLDLRDLRRAITACRRCSRGGNGIPGCGEPGADLFLLAGRPGPGAAPDNPWGEWRDDFHRKVIEEWGWSFGGVYFSTALRCPLEDVTPAALRRCAGYLAEELFAIGPRLVVVSGKLAAVTLRVALGDEVPGKPRSGDICGLFSTRFLFELDVARIKREKEAAEIFWNVLRKAEELVPLTKRN